MERRLWMSLKALEFFEIEMLTVEEDLFGFFLLDELRKGQREEGPWIKRKFM